jgi:hypothetical protein
MYNFGFQGCAVSNVESYPTFWHNCSCHLQGEYVLAGHFWKPYTGQAVDGEWDMTDLIGGAEE